MGDLLRVDRVADVPECAEPLPQATRERREFPLNSIGVPPLASLGRDDTGESLHIHSALNASSSALLSRYEGVLHTSVRSLGTLRGRVWKLHNGRVSLSDEYSRQRRWRAWNRIYSVLPDVRGKTILDLGCAIGDQAAELVARGASVIGIDANEELLRVARSRGIGNAEFRSGDLRDLDLALEADGIWCSFSVAYIANPQRHLMSWSQRLRPGGWMAVTEIDDLFGHEPLSDRAKSLIGAYETKALKTGRYDFRAGRKLQTYLEQAGLAIESVLVCDDTELSFDGPATPEVIEAWRDRFARMPLLKSLCGDEFDAVRDEFLACLSMREHRSLAKVYCVVARYTQPQY